ncbi:MAG TPA: DUF6174 domain-containing protein [Actinomycetes bacterium]|nr:DUF6174 domain-containing protein [Actinomycetes bacterium]
MTTHRMLGLLVVLATALSATTGCTDASGPAVAPTAGTTKATPPAGLPEEAQQAWSTWNAAGMDDYHYTLSVGCFCPAALGVRVVVVNDDVQTIDASSQQRQLIRHFFHGPPTVDAMFAAIVEAEATADSVTLKFDETTGVPKSIYIDYASNGVDDEIGISTDEFGRGGPVLVD